MTPRQRMRFMLAGGLGLALLLTLFLDIAVLVVPIYDMQLYDRVLQSRNMDTLVALSVACVVGLAVYGVLEYLRSTCFIELGQSLGRHLDATVLDVALRHAAAGDVSVGPQMVRDLSEIQGFLASGAVAVPLDALCAPLFLTVLFMLHPALGFVGLGGVALLVLTGLAAEWLVGPRLLAAQARRTLAQQELTRSLSEPELGDGLGMLPAIGRRWAARHGVAQEGLDRAGGQALAMAGLSRLLRMGLQAGIMSLGAVLVLAGAATPGTLMGSNLLFGKLVAPFDHLVSSWRSWALAHAAWRRMDGMLSAPPALTPAPSGHREWAGLWVEDAALHTADGRVLLHGIDFRAPPGTLVAVTGLNGAGKTTLLRLLAGLMPPTSGAVLLDSMPVYGGDGVGYLPQNVALLEGSVAQNIARFQDGAIDKAIDAARLAEVHDPVGRMARGYDTELTGRGAALSGGMRQRVGLARALFGSPRLLVLDEPDASLDNEGAQALTRAILSARDAGAVVVVTSHRTSLAEAADMVLDMRDGTLVDTTLPIAVARPAHLASA